MLVNERLLPNRGDKLQIAHLIMMRLYGNLLIYEEVIVMFVKKIKICLDNNELRLLADILIY